MSNLSRFSICGLFGVALVIGAGCDSQPPLPKTYPVSGKVVYKGKQPMKKGSIEFHYESDPLLRIVSEIGDDGTFTLGTVKDKLTADGAPEGEYQVTVRPALAETKGAGGQGKFVEAIKLEKKYKVEANATTLEIELPTSPP